MYEGLHVLCFCSLINFFITCVCSLLIRATQEVVERMGPWQEIDTNSRLTALSSSRSLIAAFKCRILSASKGHIGGILLKIDSRHCAWTISNHPDPSAPSGLRRFSHFAPLQSTPKWAYSWYHCVDSRRCISMRY